MTLFWRLADRGRLFFVISNWQEASIQDLIQQLAQTVKERFGDFEDAVATDATKTPVLDETVHPLTSYVINYVKFLME